MVKSLINVFLDMLAWSEGPITTPENQKIMVMTSQKSYFIDYSDHPRKLVTLNPNSNQQAPDATSSFLLWDVTGKQLA